MAKEFPILGRLVRLAKMRSSLGRNGSEATVTFPGFGIDDLDRTGNISVIRALKLLATSQMVAFQEPLPGTEKSFLDGHKLKKEVYTSIASSSTEVSRQFYRLPDMQKLPNLVTTHRLGCSGNSSLSGVNSLVDVDSGTELARYDNLVVAIKLPTMKPTGLPDWWKEKYGNAAMNTQKLIVDRINVPEDAYVTEFQVPWSAAGPIQGTTYIAYPEFHFEAAMRAMRAGFYSKFPIGEDILSCHVKKMVMCHPNLSYPGDMLKLSLWENTDNPLILHFDISKNGKCVNQATMEFYDK